MRKIRARYFLLSALFALTMLLITACDSSKPSKNTKETPVPTVKATAAPVARDISKDTPLARSIVYADSLKNNVQAYYSASDKSSYEIKNKTLDVQLGLLNDKGVRYIKDYMGNKLVESSVDVFVTMKDGIRRYDRYSATNLRENTTKLGYYYYQTHIRDYIFGIPSEQKEASYSNELDLGFEKYNTWHVNDMSAPVSDGKSVTVEVTNSYDPYIVQDGLSVSQGTYSALLVTMKVKGLATSAALYFYTSVTKGFNSAQVVSFTIDNDGEYHTYMVDLRASGELEGSLRGIRIDVGTNVGDTITIKSVKSVLLDTDAAPFKGDRIIHTYSDRVYQEIRVIATDKTDKLKEYGMETKVLKSRVDSYEFNEAEGYVAFDITTSGIFGFIIPNDGTTFSVTLTEEGDYYVFRQYSVIPESIEEGEDIVFSNRLYNDFTHSFDGIKKATYIEHNPLNEINVISSNASGKFIGYDKACGAYRFTQNGTDFSTAYIKKNNNKYFKVEIGIVNDSYDRDIFIWTNGKSGCLEASCVLDANDNLVPIPIEVCKNFSGEKEEPFYDPKDTAYGDAYFPISLKANESTSFTSLHLYQNWGVYPLKQLSSIQFHISYYHLSTGVTESNCIAPYFVYGKDSWVLPDFRGCSGDIWAGQPQFNAVGRPRFFTYTNDKNAFIRSEYTGSDIVSSGTSYADIRYSYISDCGSYKYTLRHVEFPQTDENRTYYTIDLEFLKDVTIKDMRNLFSIFDMDGRSDRFQKTSYTDKDGNVVEKDMDLSRSFEESYVLSKNNAFVSYYDIRHDNQSQITNFALLIKNYDIVIDGKKWDGNFIYRNKYDGVLNYCAISLDEGNVSFKKGDTMHINMILLPWGTLVEKTNENVMYVYEDSIKYPLSIQAISGTVVPDDHLMRILCNNNSAEFTISGGRNNNPVRVDGFTSLKRPVIYEKAQDGTYSVYDTSVEEYDGLQVSYMNDGTYSYTFVYTMSGVNTSRTFKICIE